MHEHHAVWRPCNYGGSCVSYGIVRRWNERFRAGKSALKMVTVRRLCFLWEKGNHTEEHPYVIIPELKDRCAASIGTAKKNVCDDLNLRKTATRWTPCLTQLTDILTLLTDWQKIWDKDDCYRSNRSVPFSRLCEQTGKRNIVECLQALLRMFEPDGSKRLCDMVTGNE